MLTLNDGRSELWQWDTGRKLTVDADCSQVHFSNKVFGRSIDVDVVDGVAVIPDILLQTDKDLNVWAFVGTPENGYTKISKVFKVNKRSKPADYVFTPPEQTTLEEIKEKLDYLESIQDPDAIKNAVDEYLANNPIQIDEKDPTVPDWAKQATKPKYTATEVGAVATVNGVKPDANGNVEITIPDSGGNADQTIETVLALDEVCIGRYANGVLESTYNRAICTKGFIKPFVVSVTLTSADYRFAVAVYNNGAYVRTDGWLASDTVYTFDHDAYQYKMYFSRVDGEYVQDLDRCRQSVKLTISAADILESYNALEVKSDTERRNTKNAVEYMMRRNYDISYANAPAPLNLISYVGNNQIVHPKVLYFPDKFGGHKFWMAYTPYPFANDRYENPCVAYSDDGYAWTNIPGNPLFDAAGSGFCSDTHLVYVETTGKLEVWYRYAHYGLTPVPEIMYRQTSTDGLNWTEKEVIVKNTSGDYVQYLSPAVIHDGSKYKLWVVNNTENRINYYESGASTPGETIALDGSMTVGAVYTSGKVDATKTDYMYTAKIKLNASKSFQLTAKNLSGYTIHPDLRYVTAYDADGNVLSDYSLQNIAEATAANGRVITMDESVDSVIISIYKAFDYTNKTIILPAVEDSGELVKVRDITLNYQDGETVYNPWHIDVIEDNGKTVLLVMCKSGTEWSLFLATSDDNVSFTAPELVMVGNPYGWDNQLYRSSIVNVDGEYRIYYSAQDVKQRHGLGICTSNTLSNFVGTW